VLLWYKFGGVDVDKIPDRYDGLLRVILRTGTVREKRFLKRTFLTS
jgi:hypothetical protein